MTLTTGYRRLLVKGAASAVSVCFLGVAAADDPPAENVEAETVRLDPERPTLSPDQPYRTDLEPEEPGSEPIGYRITVGAGIGGFMMSSLRDSSPGGAWHARALVGARSKFGFEASYVGSSQSIQGAAELANGTQLVGHGAQAALRMQVAPDRSVQPFLSGGVGWRRYTLDHGGPMSEADHVFELPFALGMAARYLGAVAELRVEYRFVSGEDLVLGAPGLERWALVGSVGYEI